MIDADDTVSRLIARIEQLEDERAIRTTLHRYSHAIDHGDEAGWVELFTPDAVIEMRNSQTSEVVRPTVGREQLARLVSRHTRAPEQWHQHVVANTTVVLDGATARAESYFFLLLHRHGVPEVAAFGRYHDDLVRETDGTWRFRHRSIELDSASEFQVFRPRPTPGQAPG